MPKILAMPLAVTPDNTMEDPCMQWYYHGTLTLCQQYQGNRGTWAAGQQNHGTMVGYMLHQQQASSAMVVPCNGSSTMVHEQKANSTMVVPW